MNKSLFLPILLLMGTLGWYATVGGDASPDRTTARDVAYAALEKRVEKLEAQTKSHEEKFGRYLRPNTTLFSVNRDLDSLEDTVKDLEDEVRDLQRTLRDLRR